MSSPEQRIACTTPGCTRTILTSTAERTGGICMPCVAQAAHDARQAYISKNKEYKQLCEGLTDSVEIILCIHTTEYNNPLIQWIPYPIRLEQLYAKLTQADIERLLALVIHDIRTNADLTEPYDTILTYLIAYTKAPLDTLMEEMCQHRIFNFPMVFLGAPAAIRKQLLQYEEDIAQKTINVNQWLLCLAWIGDDAIVAQFAAWRNHPPIWSEALYVPPHAYAPSAGWELTPDGKRRNLYFSQGIRLSTQVKASSVTRLGSTTTACPECHQAIQAFSAHIATLPLQDIPRLAPGADLVEDPIHIPYCAECSAFDTYFVSYHPHIATIFNQKNQTADEDPNDEPLPTLYPDPQLPVISTTDWGYLSEDYSQIGGLPAWVQDAEYPSCPTCNTTMRFFAQIALATLDPSNEGIYYMFICSDCQMSASSYQQS